MSRDGARPRNVQFVDVTARDRIVETPAWLLGRAEDLQLGPGQPVSPLLPPEVPSHARPALAPLLESLRPPTRPPSQFPPGLGRSGPASLTPTGLASVSPPARPPSQYPAAGGMPSQFPAAPGMPSQFPPGTAASHGGGPSQAAADAALADAAAPGGRDRRRDTLIEDLVPRAEEEAVQAIKAAIERFAEERAQALEQAEQELLELVKVICRRVVLREVTLSSSVIESLVQEGLSALGRNDQVTVRLGPFFADALEHISDNLQHRGIRCSVLIDPAVGAHGCMLETALGKVDESVETRLNVLFASLDSVP